MRGIEIRQFTHSAEIKREIPFCTRKRSETYSFKCYAHKTSIVLFCLLPGSPLILVFLCCLSRNSIVLKLLSVMRLKGPLFSFVYVRINTRTGQWHLTVRYGSITAACQHNIIWYRSIYSIWLCTTGLETPVFTWLLCTKSIVVLAIYLINQVVLKNYHVIPQKAPTGPFLFAHAKKRYFDIFTLDILKQQLFRSVCVCVNVTTC